MVQLGAAVLARVQDVLAQPLLGDLVLADGHVHGRAAAAAGRHLRVLIGGLDVHRVAARGLRARQRVAAAVGADDEAREALVLGGLDCVADDDEDVKTREDGLGELDVGREGDG